ncbi:SPOR domain-containing protein [Portibacter marinus]|uniref:SPOR domain-containing protein n=1 Tax=Portibacter marinus TaxID=2898660 RepID=UPI001F162264|nr:SPOR domain-containing protein [Portibacter marinus]
MKQLLFFFFLIIGVPMFAQVTINEEPKISRLMNSYISQSRSTEYVQGWRIQLITTNDRRKMEAARAKCANLYPGLEPEWKHVSPYYQVQIGAYRTKLELQSFLLALKEDFPNAIPVMDKILETELL